MKKVLIALDYDPTAQKVAEAGYEFAKLIGANVLLLHVVADPIYYANTAYSPIMGFSGYLNDDPMQLYTVEALKSASLNYLAKSRIHLDDPSIEILVEEGDSASVIIKAAQKWHATYIVLGSHSRKWLENIVMGSVTEQVLHQTTLPLFIIPTKRHS